MSIEILTPSSPTPDVSKTSSKNTGGSTHHLSEPAKALILERILAGDTNRQINHALQKAKHIAPNMPISKTTLTKYRSCDEARVQVRRLSIEAIQVGHNALSKLILMHTNILEQTHAVLFPNGVFVKVANNTHFLAARLLTASSKFLWDTLWTSGLPESIHEEEKLREALERLEESEKLPEEQAAIIRMEVKRLLNGALQDLVMKKRAEDEKRRAAAGQVAEPERGTDEGTNPEGGAGEQPT